MRFLQGIGAACVGVGIVGAAVVACSSDSTPASGSNKDGGSSGTSGSAPAVDGTLGGTWDVVATGDDQSQGTGTVTLSSTALLVKVGSTSLDYSVSGSSAKLKYSIGDESADISVEHTDKTFDTGAILLPLGGDWTFTDRSKCDATVGTDSTFLCEDVDFPDPWPNPREGVNYQGHRTKTADSSFGDLGGSWTFGTTDDPDNCEVSFTGKKVHLQCMSLRRLTGAVDITFSDDFKSLSGNTSGDIELSGQKK